MHSFSDFHTRNHTHFASDQLVISKTAVKCITVRWFRITLLLSNGRKHQVWHTNPLPYCKQIQPRCHVIWLSGKGGGTGNSFCHTLCYHVPKYVYNWVPKQPGTLFISQIKNNTSAYNKDTRHPNRMSPAIYATLIPSHKRRNHQQNLAHSNFLCIKYVPSSSVLVKEDFFASFMYIEHIVELGVKNYSKSSQKLEDGMIPRQLILRVILKEHKCLCHVSE